MSEFLKTQKQLNKRVLPPQERPRNWKGFFPQNKACCPGIKHSYKNYYLVINELCENYNMLHATKTRFCLDFRGK
ncbi:MAG: hypothetical protein LUC43_04110 [Burkholderiales bacterium]|nr:hypothetical protein [Burkholderiales bacterium]